MSDDPEVNPGTSVPTPPTQPPDSSLFPQGHTIIDHPWQPAPLDLPSAPIPAPPVMPPVVVDEPYAAQEVGSDTATCTMGNWENEPHTYIYQWLRDGINIPGGTTDQYPITSADAGRTLTCVVTAINNGGGGSATSSAVVAVYTPPT